MKKLKYFGGISAFFILLLVLARSYDVESALRARQKRETECSKIMSEQEKKYAGILLTLSQHNPALQTSVGIFLSSTTFAERNQRFSELTMQGGVILSKIDASNVSERKMVDEALGAINRRSVILKECGL